MLTPGPGAGPCILLNRAGKVNFSEHPEKSQWNPPLSSLKVDACLVHPVPVALPSPPLPMGCPDPDLEEGRKPSPDACLPSIFTFLSSSSSLIEWGYEYLLGKVVPRIKGEDSHGLALGKLLGHSQLMLLFFQGKGPVACTAYGQNGFPN